MMLLLLLSIRLWPPFAVSAPLSLACSLRDCSPLARSLG